MMKLYLVIHLNKCVTLWKSKNTQLSTHVHCELERKAFTSASHSDAFGSQFCVNLPFANLIMTGFHKHSDQKINLSLSKVL